MLCLPRRLRLTGTDHILHTKLITKTLICDSIHVVSGPYTMFGTTFEGIES